jgi:hypothetical protein
MTNRLLSKRQQDVGSSANSSAARMVRALVGAGGHRRAVWETRHCVLNRRPILGTAGQHRADSWATKCPAALEQGQKRCFPTS